MACNLILGPVEKEHNIRKSELDDTENIHCLSHSLNQDIVSNQNRDKLRFCKYCRLWTVNQKFGRIYTYEPHCAVCGSDSTNKFRQWRLSNSVKSAVKLTWVTKPIVAVMFVVFVVFVVFVQSIQNGA